MYDKGTNTLWRQFRGEPAVGQLVGSGITLEVLPVTLTNWSSWLKAHPNTSVLDVRTGVYPAAAYLLESNLSSVYSSYRGSEDTMFPVPYRSTILPTKSRVLGLTFNGVARAYPESVLRQTPVLNDTLGGRDLVVVTPDDGRGSRAYLRTGQTFIGLKKGGDGGSKVILIDSNGLSWRLDESALFSIGDPPQSLQRLPSRSSFWFGWYSFSPSTQVHGDSTQKN